MKINNNSFGLNEKLSVLIDSSNNDGLIFIPKNIQLTAEVENYYGKITINSIAISPLESEFQINKVSVENNIPNLDIKLLDRYIYKVLSDKAGLAMRATEGARPATQATPCMWCGSRSLGQQVPLNSHQASRTPM